MGIIDINDKMLLEQVINFCGMPFDGPSFHPLDQEVKNLLETLLHKVEAGNGKKGQGTELSYEANEDIDSLWSMLIEKSVMCLRYFDKREPFLGNEKQSESQKQPYVYGLDSLNDYHRKYIDFESVLYGSDAYYRDHVFHVVRVWLLGIYLLLTDNTHIIGANANKRLIDVIHFEGNGESTIKTVSKDELKLSEGQKKALEQGSIFYKWGDGCVRIHLDRDNNQNVRMMPVNEFGGDINLLEKLSMWTMIALCHDLGYPLEKSRKILAKTEEMMEVFVSQPNINGDLKFDGTRDSNNKDIIMFTSKKMKAVDESIDENNWSALYKASIQEKYKFKYMLSLESFAHGVISSIIIYKKLNYFKETDNNSDANYVFQAEDARQFYIRRDILRAIASHTCQDIYHIDVATFPMLLFICDELQEWGRKNWKSMYEGVTNHAVELSLSTFHSDKIEYTEKIDMSNAGTRQLVDNIRRILQKQYMLYQMTFRDGQYTARRKFDYEKHIDITVNAKYKSIQAIKIDFGIVHGSGNNFFRIHIRDSGYKDTDAQVTNTLVESLKELMNPYINNKKYGDCTIEDERDKGVT